jgi:hypothetical protein
MTVLIYLTTAGAGTGPFSLYSNVDGYVTPFETGVPKVSLTTLPGYTTALVPNGTTTIRVQSTGACTNYIDIVIGATTTTTTTVPGTTTTTTTVPEDVILTYYYRGATDTSGANNIFVYELSSPLSTNITLSGAEIEAYNDGGACSTIAHSDLSGSVTITAGNVAGIYTTSSQFCDQRYRRLNTITVNGTPAVSGDTVIVGGTPVIVLISTGCGILSCIN